MTSDSPQLEQIDRAVTPANCRLYYFRKVKMEVPIR